MWIWLIAHSLDIVVILGATVLMLLAYVFSDNILNFINKFNKNNK